MVPIEVGRLVCEHALAKILSRGVGWNFVTLVNMKTLKLLYVYVNLFVS